MEKDLTLTQKRFKYGSHHLAGEQEKKGIKQWWKTPTASTIHDPFPLQPSKWKLLLTTDLGGSGITH